MKAAGILRAAMLLGGFLAAVALIGGCAAQKEKPADWWGDPETGIILEYRMPEAKALTYVVTNEQSQSMEIMGQPADVTFDQELVFDLVPGPRGEAGQDVEITLQSFAINMVTPQGTFSPETDDLAGKGFKMAVGPRGEESGCEGAETLTYTVPESGEQSLSEQFCEFFPDLPEKPVKIGDSWETTMTLDIGDSGTDAKLNIESLNTLAGFEEFAGHDCARIETEFSGTVEGSGSQGPATFVMTGTIEGSGTSHFAYKEGTFVSDFSMGVSDGEISVQGPQEMTIPTTREFVMEARLAQPGESTTTAERPAPKKKTDLKPITEATATPAEEMKAGAALEPEIVDAGGFTAAGMRRRFESAADATSEAFEDLWMNGFMPQHEALLPLSTDKKYYGVSYATGEGESFYYLAGMAVDEGAVLPEGMSSIDVPGGHYAVFETDLEGISQTWNQAFEVWLPKSGLSYDWTAPSYEEYPPEMGEDASVLIYLPIVKGE